MQIENRVSIGNIISLVATLLTGVGMAAGLFLWGGRIGQQVTGHGRDLLQVQTTIAGHDSRIRAMEQSAARQDERLILILDSLRKIENRLERGSP